MRASVVIATTNRAASLKLTLDALRHQTHRDLEVIVVQGPCEDVTPELLAERSDELRVFENPVRNLCISRNIGIDAAAGDVVAFIDDDGIPERDWVAALVAGYASEQVGGTGGLVFDQTGVNLQYRYALCDRVGRTFFDRMPPFDEYNKPGSDPFVYLQGTNMSFRREALVQVGGFDENIEYIWDESDLALRVIDAGWTIEPLNGAAVHHKMLPSHVRRGKGHVTDPYTSVKNRAYFALKNGTDHMPMEEVFRSLTDYVDTLRHWAEDSELHGRFSAREAAHFVARMEEGFEAGVKQGMHSERRTRELAKRDADAFVRYPTIAPEGERLRLCLVSLDYRPRSMGGIARYTEDLARGLAQRGHDVHVVTRADPPYRIDFEDGVWVHRYPEGPRLLPSLDGHPLRDNFAHVTAVWQAVSRVADRAPVDVVAGNVWIAEPLVCELDPRWPTVLMCSTPIRTIAATQRAVAAKSHTGWQIKLEDAAVAHADHLVPVSKANLETVRRETPTPAEVPATVVWHGMVDRAGGPIDPPDRPEEGAEILFVGRLEPRKGVETLLDAGIEVLRQRPHVRLRIAGANNPYAAEDDRTYDQRVTERLASEPHLRQRISFEGEVDEIRLDQLFTGCDIFCAPSLYESFGLMNLEAMMFSRPVVSSRVGGIQEVVVDGETGLLVEPRDSTALRDALLKLVDDRPLRERMGAAGRKRFEAEFDNEIAVTRTLGVFREVLSRRHAEKAEDEEATLEAEECVRQNLARVLADLEVEQPADAAEELLEPATFPHDHMASIAMLENASDHDFVVGLYRALLGRDPESAGLHAKLLALASGATTRRNVIREIATSDEARLHGIDDRFLEKLNAGAPVEMERRVRDAFWRDDKTFARLLVETLLDAAVDQDGEADRICTALSEGASRRDVLETLLTRKDVTDRKPEAAEMSERMFLTQAELTARLADLAETADADFVRVSYRLLLGREPDPAGLSEWSTRLAVESRKAVLIEIAASHEAQQRGIDPLVVEAAAEPVTALSDVPAPPPDRPSPKTRVRRIARRALRDPRIEELRQDIDRKAEETTESVRQLGPLLAQLRDDGTTERIGAELRALYEQVAALSATVEGLVASTRSGEADAINRDQRITRALTAIGDRLDQPAPGPYGTFLGNDRVLVNTTWGGKLLAPAGDLSLTPELVAHGVYEPDFTNFLIRVLEQGDTVVDVGANIGMYTVLMASIVGEEGRVFAYEPNPDLHGLLIDNVSLNWLSDRVVLKKSAAGRERGMTTLHVTERFMGNSSLLEPTESYFANAQSDTVRTVEVETEPLDDLAQSEPIAVIKIDVEGAERFVFEGMNEMLRRRAVRYVAFEVYRERMGPEWDPFCQLLRSHSESGWTFNLVSADGTLEFVDLETILDVGRYSQVVMGSD